MAEFTPKYLPGQAITSYASADITGGQLVIVTGVNTVGPGTANSIAVVGTAAFDATTGSPVTIYAGGVHVLNASGAITAGAQVVCAAAGAVSALGAVTTPTAADVTNTRAIVGKALDTAANGKVTVQLG